MVREVNSVHLWGGKGKGEKRLPTREKKSKERRKKLPS